MEPPDFESLNITAQPTPFTHPVCEGWSGASEGSVFHLANIFLFLGFMGGSGLYGLLYLFTFLTVGFFCSTIWSWSDPCTTDTFLWTFALFCACLGQTLHVSYRLRSVTFEKELEELYHCVFKKLGVSLTQYGKIVACCERDVQTLERDHCFAVEGKTAIDKLSVLLTGRIRVTVNGEFLHHIYPFQFLDSPEWDSLRPSEEGIFQVTLRAENRCRYVTWRRKKLYLLFAKHRYLAKIFALVVRNDIADKLYSLNDKAFDSSGHRYDLRLPSFCHPPNPSTDPDRAEGQLHLPTPSAGQDRAEGQLHLPTPSAGQDRAEGQLHLPTPSAGQDRAEGQLHPRTPSAGQDRAEGQLHPPTPSAGQGRAEGQLHPPTPSAGQDRAEGQLHLPTPSAGQDRAEGQLHLPTPSAGQDRAEGQLHLPTPSAGQDRAEGQLHLPTPSAGQDRAEGQLHLPTPSAGQDRAEGQPQPPIPPARHSKLGTRRHQSIPEKDKQETHRHPLPSSTEQDRAEGRLHPRTPSAEQDRAEGQVSDQERTA